MVWTFGKPNIAVNSFLDNWKTELHNLRYSNVFGTPMFGIQAPALCILLLKNMWNWFDVKAVLWIV